MTSEAVRVERPVLDVDLSQKTALVIGGSGGIGSAVARRFADSGASIILHYHQRPTEAERCKAEIEEAWRHVDVRGPRVRTLSANIADKDEVELLHRKITADALRRT